MVEGLYWETLSRGAYILDLLFMAQVALTTSLLA